MSELKDRIKILSEELFEGNLTKFGKSIETSDTSISNYINGSSFPGFQFIFKLCTKLNIDPNWLILGLGERYLSETINNVNGNDNNVGYQKIGNNNSNITQVMHSNDILHNENDALKRENELLREMLEILKNQGKK
ncbi:hypothetical protein A0O34_14930 [Chryseobacterium glaciei]|uniref:HTH cro/C1-type domain-containing protein n=1 Tax=Chryseobacterium glaciei TaxID=1685010 RepID=A0A172XXH9_9FLAO|nr:helix-turn-helix transcriptional regulator [Chryseobacterium glaciei]ANF51719.1 hypothetical protein A0O34_14930 [Chryseobacterium glaciei]